MGRIGNIFSFVNRETNGQLKIFFIVVAWYLTTVALYFQNFLPHLPGLDEINLSTITVGMSVLLLFDLTLHGILYAAIAFVGFIILFMIYKFLRWVLKVFTLFGTAIRTEYQIPQPNNSKIRFN